MPGLTDLQPIHTAPESFIKRCIFSTDHKVIARQFLWLGFAFMLIGGIEAMMIRWQWAHPGEPVPILGNILFGASGGVISPAQYNSIFTTHGLIMIFWAITPILIGAFGNLCIPLMIGARDMAFPKLNMASFWFAFLSGMFVLASLVSPLGPGGAGWTTYAPLSTNVGTPGWGQTWLVFGIFFIGLSSITGGINYVTTVIRLRAPGMTWMRMPLTVWGLWLTAILNVLFVPVLGSAGLLLIMDRVFGTEFFVAGALAGQNAGDPIVFQHLFWIFGHPEVYILILPAWGIVGDLVSFFCRKPAYWYRGSVYAMVAVSILSAVVYGHHMYLTGMNPLLGKSFMLLTLIISVPAEMLFLNWLHTIWKGNMRHETPMLFALGVIFVFGLGGLTGLHLATISTDIYLHDTMWVVGHFHLTMAAASFLGSFAGIYFWFPKFFGTLLNEKLGKAHFYGSTIFITLTFMGQIVVGYAGQQRRLYDPYFYTFLEHLQPLNQMTSYFAWALGLFQLCFVVNFFWSVFKGKPASDNPWDVGTLDWSVSSPPPVHNFDPIPVVVRGPHEYGNPEVIKAIGRDYLSQTETYPPPASEPERIVDPVSEAGK
ncbi:MAG: cbb3-type cytochrome c oxidase subunit I [Myxococcota bacterium]|nr:cbb3-type cytochrome c oxidase subunit I [Myxococcota bacterium]